VITICDTGPLVAYLNRNDPYHGWALALMKQARSPMLTTEPVLTEVAYFLRADRVDVDPLFQLLERGAAGSSTAMPSRVVIDVAPDKTKNRRSETDQHLATAGAGPARDR
jgi:predicted nucleic acid-binding protein